jgi:tetratricopeptide (TPR) repeat protein
MASRFWKVSIVLACVLACPTNARAAGAWIVQGEAQRELEQLLARERAQADLARRRGEPRLALKILSEHLDDEPTDAASRTLRALVRWDRGEVETALADGRRAMEDATDTSVALRRACGRNLAGMLTELGRVAEALEVLDAAGLDAVGDPRDAWVLGCALAEGRGREAARRVLEMGAAAAAEPSPSTYLEDQGPAGGLAWRWALARGRCEAWLGRLERASGTFVAALDVAASGGRADDPGGAEEEPDLLSALADVYFEADREVEKAARRSPENLYREALKKNPTHASALLGRFRLYRYNRQRRRHRPQEFLAALLGAHPKHVDGWMASVEADLEDGRLLAARRSLERLRQLAGERRGVRALGAALAAVEQRHEDARAILDGLAGRDPIDSAPERMVGRLLLELYRFGEALPHLQAAIAADRSDHLAWGYMGRALANLGREEEAREALENSHRAAAGRQDARRENLARVLEAMDRDYVTHRAGEHTFRWRPDGAPVLEVYLVPHYAEAREDLARRYGYSPGPVLIEVFRKHERFSVRSVGFEGFPALGVCFGAVVTAVSPLAKMRGTFSWARTSFHEFTHVIHLGLSHNRCPRWITEGLATWEEVRANPAWTRNMRRDLVDARANGQLIPVRELNRAFRGPRILFGYYQGGLLCELLIAEHGFPSLVAFLEAFDRGLDLDAALDEVFGITAEELDAAFAAHVDSKLADIRIEPRWDARHVATARLGLSSKPPADAEARAGWEDAWCTQAWAAWQDGRTVDAQEALRVLAANSPAVEPTRAHFLRAEIALARGDRDAARELIEAALASGGPGAREFRSLVTLGILRRDADDPAVATDGALEAWAAAETCFPGYREQALAPELLAAELLLDRGDAGDTDAARVAQERWLAWNGGSFDLFVEVARWHQGAGRFPEAAERWRLANEVDPFVRSLHWEWGQALLDAGRPQEALREFRVGPLVPPALDGEGAGPLSDGDRARWRAAEEKCLLLLEEGAGESGKGG